MPRSKQSAQPRQANLTLEQTRQAVVKIERRIDELKTFNVQDIREKFDPQLNALEKKTNSTLQDVFGHDTIEYLQYRVSFDPAVYGGRAEPLSAIIQDRAKRIERAVTNLSALKALLTERVEDQTALIKSAPAASTTESIELSRSVFIVHGHDDGTKEQIARFVSTLGLNPLILHEQPNRGKTIIEKIEHHSSVGFAVVLFTPDDVAFARDNPKDSKPRARQNVILELGFFMGKLGRERVCVLYKEGVELPSDYHGVAYIPLDASGAWRSLLAREFKSAGLDVDMNPAI
ncbi:MAG: nucleotide-binding protein [Bdellovibrionota bacterium]